VKPSHDTPDRAAHHDSQLDPGATVGHGAHSWCADTVLPGCSCSQVKALPGSSAVTVYVPVGIRGWETSTRDPTASGPASGDGPLHAPHLPVGRPEDDSPIPRTPKPPGASRSHPPQVPRAGDTRLHPRLRSRLALSLFSVTIYQ
jgi:hypothetical protein